jgi:hypothetical protein
MYIVYCALIVYSCIPIQLNFFPFIQSNILNILFKCFVSINFRSQTLLFDYFPIIVQYSDPGNVFQVFRSHKEVTIICNLG